MGHVRPRAAAATAVLGMAVLAVGCQAGSSASNGSSGTSVTVAAVPGIDTAPLYIASHEGLFSHAGISVHILPVSSPAQELQALTSGRASIAAGDYASFFHYQAVSKVLRLVADGYDAAPGVMEVLALPGSGITSPRDLAGKTIGVPNTGGLPGGSGQTFSLATVATTSVLQSNSVNLTTIRWQPMAPQDLVHALAERRVDAILATEPYIYQAESQLGAVEVLDSCSGATAGLPLSGYFTTSAWARQNSGALAGFRSALQRAQADAAMWGPVRNALARYASIPSQAAQVLTVGSYPTSTNASNIQRVADLLSNLGAISAPIDVGRMIAR
jgi:NitT/TauT family transport system substrate-binding protein